MHRVERGPPLDQVLTPANVDRKRIRELRRQLLQRLMHERALHFRGELPGLLVDGYDTPGVYRRGIPLGLVDSFDSFESFVRFDSFDKFVLRTLHLQAVRRQLELPEQDDALVRAEDVVQEWLIEPDRAQAPRAIPHEHLEDLEPRPARRTHAAAQDLARDRGRYAGLQRRDGLEMSPVFIACGKPIQQILDRRQTDPLQIRRASRTYTLEILQ